MEATINDFGVITNPEIFNLIEDKEMCIKVKISEHKGMFYNGLHISLNKFNCGLGFSPNIKDKCYNKKKEAFNNAFDYAKRYILNEYENQKDKEKVSKKLEELIPDEFKKEIQLTLF